MRDLDSLEFHPTSEKLVDILCKKVQNDNPKFFRLNLNYYLTKLAASMRVKIRTKDRGDIPVNLYAINFATSGLGKGHSTNIIEEQLIHVFREVFFTETYPVVVEHSLAELATKRAMISGETEEATLELVKKEFAELGQLAFSFDSATSPAIKQMRHKLLMSNIGAVNLEMDELGSNLLGNTEPLTTFLELFDVGKVKQKLTKNTKESTRSEEIDGRTPTNLMLYGTPDKVFDGSKVETELISFFETGYGRRCFFGISKHHKKSSTITPEEIYNALTDTSTNQYLQDMAVKLGELAHITNHNKIITVSKQVSILIIEYRLLCERRADEMSEHQGIAKAELSHRYFKAMKLAGTYAFIDGSSEITEDHFYYAVCAAEESGKAFDEIMARDRPYVKLAKYIATIGREVTHVELAEDLVFYRGSMTAKQELIQMASAWGHKEGIVIKRTLTSGIEFIRGETLQVADLEALHLSYSDHIADGYENVRVGWGDLYNLTQEPHKHWINHHSVNGHRSEENIVPGFDMVVLDVDGTASADECVALLKDYKFLLYTTKRHSDTKHRFRLILPMNYHIKLDPADYRQFMANVYEWLPIEVDTQTAQRSRKWLTNKGQHYYNEGTEVVDARMFIPKTAKNDEQKVFITTYQSMTNMERWFVSGSVNGNRNNQLARYALMLVDLGYDAETIKDKTLEMNSKLTDSLPVKEIQSTILLSVARKIAKIATP